MSYYLIDTTKNIKDVCTFDLDNIIIDNKIDINTEMSKYLLYYKDTFAKDIFIKTPKIRLTYNWSNLKYNQLKIRITPRYEITDDFIDFIKSLEEHIKNHKYFNKKKLEFVSILNKENSNYYLKAYHQEDKTKIISDDNINKIHDFKANAEIQLVIRISHIWRKNNRFGLSCLIYQIRYYSSNDIDFFDTPRINIVNTVPNIPKQVVQPVINQTSDMKRLIINPDMLKSVKLNKIK